MKRKCEKLLLVLFIALICVFVSGSWCWGIEFRTYGFSPVEISDIQFNQEVNWFKGDVVAGDFFAYNVTPVLPDWENGSYLMWQGGTNDAFFENGKGGYGYIGDFFILHKGTFFEDTGWDQLEIKFNLSLGFEIWDDNGPFAFYWTTPEFPVIVTETVDKLLLEYPEGVPSTIAWIYGSKYFIELELPTTDLHGVAAEFRITKIPEPSTMLLLGSGLIGLAGYGRRKFFKK